MKKLFQIGIILLFMIGMCSVQLDYSTSMLVDDDVGVEFATNIDVIENDAILIVMIIDNPSQVAAPLKYPMVTSEINITYNRDCEVWKEFTTDCTVADMALTVIQDDITIPEISSTNLISENQTGEKLANRIEGLYRLEIGENYWKT